MKTAVLLLLQFFLARGVVAAAQPKEAAPPPTAGETATAQMVAGRVLSAADGHPIANARVQLSLQVRNLRRRSGPGAPMQNVQTQGEQAQTAQTDGEGRFRMTVPAAGRYTLQASAVGYVTALYLQHDGFSTAVVTGAGLQTDNLNFALLPEASLHGRILDDTGEPVRASVMLFRDAADGAGARNTADATPSPTMAGGMQSDEDGQYQFSNLRPGRYYVAVTATPWYAVHPRSQSNEDRMQYRSAIDPALDVAYPVTFYPHATTEQTATAIDLKSGSRASANIVLQAEPAITLTVQLPPSSEGPQAGRQIFPALFSKIFGNEHGVPAAIVGRSDQTVQITGLAAGQYAMRSMGRPGLPNTETAVNLSSGSATVNLPVANTSATDLLVRLRTASGAPLDEAVTVALRRFGAPGPVEVLAAGKIEQGVAHFVNVAPGQYRLVAQQEGDAWTVSRLVVAGKAVTNRLLRVDGLPLQVEATISRYVPEVDGVVKGANAEVHPGSLVILVPAGSDAAEDLIRADQSDLDGGFQFAGVQPGNYLVVALDGNWKLNWRSVAALMPYLPHAVPVTVPASGPAVFRMAEPVIAQQK